MSHHHQHIGDPDIALESREQGFAQQEDHEAVQAVAPHPPHTNSSTGHSGVDLAERTLFFHTTHPTPRAREQFESLGSHSIVDPSQLYHVSTVSSLHHHSHHSLNIDNHQGALGSMEPFGFPQQASLQSVNSNSAMREERPGHSVDSSYGNPSSGSAQGFKCPNCPKTFARDDLLRRHLAREARAQAQPIVDRQKSCYECARSKARCDLEVPSCGRCKARGKSCMYGARSGNPNVRRGMRESREPGAEGPTNWSGTPPFVGEGSHWTSSQGYPGHHVKTEGQSTDEGESDDSHTWSESFHTYRSERGTSTSSASTNGGSHEAHQVQQHPYEHSYNFLAGNRSASPSLTNGESYLHSQPSTHSTQLARGFARSGTRGSIDTNVGGSSNSMGMNDEEGEVTPIVRPQSNLTIQTNAMGPPQITPTRYRDASMNFEPGQSDFLPGFVQPYRQVTSSVERPQPPRLLTGAKMPRPQDGSHLEQLGSSRPLFSAQLDLSGWLEEPVIPSPLYRMGPSLSALQPGLNQIMFPPTPTGNSTTVEALRNALAVNPPLPPPTLNNNTNNRESISNPSSSDTVMSQSMNQTTLEDTNDAKQSNNNNGFDKTHVAARQWWAHSFNTGQNEVDVQGVAQACAGHFTLYPALMVLPDPTSPVPPLFHRPWLAQSRLHTPPSLARVRVLLAGFHVKLPSSESMIWEMIARETNNHIHSFDQHVHASDLEVFSTTAALWFLIILLLMSSDPNGLTSVPESLVDSSLISLSHYSRLLSQRLKACEERRKVKGAPISFLEWGFEETMKRTLFASYSILVLQRFRETSNEIQSQLAGIELILDIPLPATALEFEAGNELDWRASQHVQISNDTPSASGATTTLSNSITIRHLLKARKEGGPEESRKEVTSYFDRHDDFTNVSLSVAFALDRGINL
ncbi:hypothetical protein CBS101457_003808 [Exobasidium rhododendri]|nr:hypothetical protein CBS101457_003808 [Exobasidium rhododendri]